MLGVVPIACLYLLGMEGINLQLCWSGWVRLEEFLLMKFVLQNCGPRVDRRITARIDLYLVVQILWKNLIFSAASSFSVLILWIAVSEKRWSVGFWLEWQSTSWFIQGFGGLFLVVFFLFFLKTWKSLFLLVMIFLLVFCGFLCVSFLQLSHDELKASCNLIAFPDVGKSKVYVCSNSLLYKHMYLFCKCFLDFKTHEVKALLYRSSCKLAWNRLLLKKKGELYCWGFFFFNEACDTSVFKTEAICQEIHALIYIPLI